MNKHNHNSNGGDLAEGAETLPRNEHVGSFVEGAKRRCRTKSSARSSRDLAPDLMVIAASRRGLLSRRYEEFVLPDDVERALDRFAKRMMGGYEAIESEDRLRCANGSVLWIEWNARTVPSDGSSTAWAGT